MGRLRSERPGPLDHRGKARLSPFVFLDLTDKRVFEIRFAFVTNLSIWRLARGKGKNENKLPRLVESSTRLSITRNG